MTKPKNILFIMCDQLRADYLSCAGHDRLETPNIDKLAERGVLFPNTFCQAPICGGSRMNFYTGRYAFSNGATWNGVPLNVNERTIGDYLKPLGYRVALVGKTHMVADEEGMERLGIDPQSDLGVHLSECGFEPYERDDGLWGNDAFPPPDLAYNRYLKKQGYNSDNGWHDFANSAEGPDGEILSGWYLRNSHLPARVKEEHSETAYMTNRAIDFITETGDQPWCLHLSYIKPHWPYMAPEPYHNMYGHNDIKPVNWSPKERENPHPVMELCMQREDSESFSRDEVRERVIPAYMGLIKQIDDHLGRLFQFMEEQGRMEDTLIVFTSDHGDYLGDHWLGEKEQFHEESVRIPFIVYDPSSEADVTRGTADNRLVESLDVVPTFIDAAGGQPPYHILEGRSLLPILHGKQPSNWRSYAVSESEFGARTAFWEHDLESHDARATMIRTADWKFVFFEAFPPQLFDLKNDPCELNDLGGDPAYGDIRQEMRDMMFESLRRRRTRITRDEAYMRMRSERSLSRKPERAVFLGVW